jgi:tetratricopeptide (TPR) repeat protein
VTKEALLQLAARLERERESARPQILALRKDLDRAWEEDVPESWQTLGFVQELTGVASSVLEQNPRESLALAQFALAVATGIARDAYPAVAIAQIEGRAWKEIGTAHRYLSDYTASLRAYDSALRAFANHGALGHDAATVTLARAIVLSEMGQFDEALAAIAQCEPVLASFSDERLIVHCNMVAAMIRHRRGDLAAARIAYEGALVAAREIGDRHTVAALYNNLAHLCVELDDGNGAMDAMANAHELFQELGQPAEMTRSEGAVARLLMHKGQYEQAIPLLRRLREEFLGMSMVEEAGVAAMDLVDSLVAVNRRNEALDLINVVLGEYRALGLSRALVALAYLRDLVRDRPSPSAGIRHVRAFIDEVRKDPALAFVPLPE